MCEPQVVTSGHSGAPVLHSLEQALEFIDEDELVEVTPDGVPSFEVVLEHERKLLEKRPSQEIGSSHFRPPSSEHSMWGISSSR